MRQLIVPTAAAIALGVGLTFAGAAPANAWGHHAARHSHATQSSRAEIRDVQQKLQADNLYHGNIDGIVGPETRRAIAEYQKQNGLRVTANLDRQTMDSLAGTTGVGTSQAHNGPGPNPMTPGAMPPPSSMSPSQGATGQGATGQGTTGQAAAGQQHGPNSATGR